MLDSFFNPLRNYFNVRSFEHFKVFCALMALSSDSKTVSRLSSFLAFGPSRGKRNDFLIQSPWDEQQVLKHTAMDQLRDLYRPGEPLFLIIDDSKKAKRGKHVEAVLKVFDPAAKRFITGHQFVTGTLYYRGITIPFALRLYLNRKSAKALKQGFKRLTALAVEIIEALQLPEAFKAKVYVLVDSYYFNQTILKAAKAKGFFVIGALKKNRNLLIRGRKCKLGIYMHNLFKRETKQSTTVQTQKGKRRDHYVWNTYTVSRVPDPLKVVFSKRGKQRNLLAIACTDLKLSASSIILYYTFRWSIGASREGRINQSVRVRPELRNPRLRSLGGTVAREQDGEALGQHPLKGGCATLQVASRINADVASLHANPVAEAVDNGRRQQGLLRWI